MTSRNNDDEWIRPGFPPSDELLTTSRKFTPTPFTTDTMDLCPVGAVGDWECSGQALLNSALSVMHELFRVKPIHLLQDGFLKKNPNLRIINWVMDLKTLVFIVMSLH